MTDSDRPGASRTPPEAKVEKAKYDGMAHVLGQLSEIVCILCGTLALLMGRLTAEQWMIVAGYCLLGPMVGKARGKVPASTTVGTGVALVTALKGAKIGVIFKALAGKTGFF